MNDQKKNIMGLPDEHSRTFMWIPYYDNHRYDNLLYERRTDTDFTIVISDGEIPCHRSVLAEKSPVLKAMLELDPNQTKVTIDHFPGPCIEAIVRYMYNLRTFIDRQYIEGLIVAVDYLQIPKIPENLLDACERDDLIYLPDNLLHWREVAEHLEIPKLAMEAKKQTIAQFFGLMKTESFRDLDFIEVGRLIKEMEVDRVHKDYLIDGSLRWMNGYKNEDPVDWMTDEDLSNFVTLIVDQWIVVPKESEVNEAREYNTLSDMSGCFVHNQLNVHRILGEHGLSEDDREQLRIDRAAALRAANPIIKPKFPACHLFETFQKLYTAHLDKHKQDGDAQPMDEDVSEDVTDSVMAGESDEDDEEQSKDERDDVVNEQYQIFVNSKRFKHALGPELLKQITVEKCSIPYIQLLVDVQNGRTENINSLDSHAHILDLPAGAIEQIEKAHLAAVAKGIRVYTAKDPYRMTIVGGRTNPGDRDHDDYRMVYVTYNNMRFEKITYVHDKCHPRFSGFCEIPPGFMIAGGGWSKQCSGYHGRMHGYVLYNPLVKKKERHAMTYINNRAYLIGGYHYVRWFTEVEFMDFNDMRWHQGPSTPRPFVNPFATGLGQSVYVMHSYKFLNCLDAVGFKWVDLPDLPEEAPASRIASDGKRVYVAGGTERQCFAYTPETNQWEILKRPIWQHTYGALCFHNNRLYLLGGVGITVVEEYDIERNEWSVSRLRMPHPLSHHFAVRMEAAEPTPDQLNKDGYPKRDDALGAHIW